MATSFIQYITEARRNPDKNQKISSYDKFIERLRKAKTLPGSNRQNLFLSFQNRLKLGVNPVAPSQSTPSGVYAYTADYAHDLVNPEDGDFGALPFKGSSQHLYMFAARGNIIDLGQMSSSDAKKYADKLLDNYRKSVKAETRGKNSTSIDEVEASVAVALGGGKPGGGLWRAIRVVAWVMSNGSGINIFTWNKVFRDLGIDGAVDPGLSIIHPAEPEQAVFFTPKAIVDVEAVVNKWSLKSQRDGRTRGETNRGIGTFSSQWKKMSMNEKIESYLGSDGGSEREKYFPLIGKMTNSDKNNFIETLIKMKKSNQYFIPESRISDAIIALGEPPAIALVFIRKMSEADLIDMLYAMKKMLLSNTIPKVHIQAIYYILDTMVSRKNLSSSILSDLDAISYDVQGMINKADGPDGKKKQSHTSLDVLISRLAFENNPLAEGK